MNAWYMEAVRCSCRQFVRFAYAFGACCLLSAAAKATPACEQRLRQPSVHCGRTPTVAFDSDGQLWAAFAFEGRVYVTRADGLSGNYRVAVPVNDVPEELDINGENRPKIAIGDAGEIYVSWTRKLPGGYNGDIRFSRSLDGGASFDNVRTINDDGVPTGHRFETLVVDKRGNVFLVWIDKRDRVAAQSEGRPYAGAALYYTLSADRGSTFQPNRKIVDHSCECCRIAASATAAGGVALFYRAVFDGGVRDHAFVAVDGNGSIQPMQRATDDNWQIEACPHHGPALLDAGDGHFDLAWFTAGETRQGVFYARFDAGSGELTRFAPVSVATSAGHPFIARDRAGLRLAWKEFTGESTVVRIITSSDDGASWSAPIDVAGTAGDSDHPLLATHRGRAYLSWHTVDEGLRIIAIDDAEEQRP